MTESTKTARAPRVLVCRKTGRRLPAKGARCPHPDEACKFRTECILYAKEVLADARHVACLMPCTMAVCEGDDGKVGPEEERMLADVVKH